MKHGLIIENKMFFKFLLHIKTETPVPLLIICF